MLHRTRTSIRKERAALLGLAAVSALAVALLAAALLAGDNRRVQVLAVSPEEGSSVPSAIRAIAIEFTPNVDRQAVLDLLTVDPPFAFAARWRGATLELLPDEPLLPGPYTVSLAAGRAGRGGEGLAGSHVWTFEIRQPSLLVVTDGPEGDALVRFEFDGTSSRLYEARQLADVAPSPDGHNVAVVAVDAEGGWSLLLVDTVTGALQTLVEPGPIRVSWVRWAPDGQSLLAVRSDRLPDGTLGVGRAWIMRITGEFVGPVDQEGEPTIGPRWSSAGDRIAYVAPASARIMVLHATTQERIELGTPRSIEFDWSPVGDRIAFESVPAGGEGTPLTQPVRIRSLDLATDIYIGVPGEIISQPRWIGPDTLAVIRRQTGTTEDGTQLWFISIPLGEKLRAVQLATGADTVPWWELSPDGERVVYVAATSAGSAVYVLDLATNERTELPLEGRQPLWLP